MMLSCEQVLQDIWSYLDRELTEADLSHVQKHLDLCRACFSRIEFERLLRDAMRTKTNHCCPEKVKARIKKILDQY
jgi:mycothiol system anti-sigma-R factor